MKYQETREKVLEVAVKCLEKGLIHGTAGNVSIIMAQLSRQKSKVFIMN